MNISTLQEYVEQHNAWGAIFGRKSLSLMIAVDRQTLASQLDSELSPENLTCDGEVRGAQLQAKYRRLTRCVDQLRSIDSSLEFYEA